MNLTEVQSPSSETKSSAFTSLLLLIAFVFLGLFVGQFLGFILLLPLFDLDLQQVMQAVANPVGAPNARTAVLVLQAGGALFGFVVTPLLHQYFIDRTDLPKLFATHRTAGLPMVLVGLLVIAFMPIISLVMEWNLSLDFGPISPTFHEWAYTKEEELRELTERLTRFESVSGLLVGMVVIAVLPAVGEELVFRGIVQRRLYTLVRNPHAAIWITALAFSAIHVQFFGFFPRLLLGALFGYLYYWSNDLWYPIAAHFVNNGFTLLMLYLHQQGQVDMDIESVETVPWSLALGALVATAGLLYLFNQQTNPPPAYE